MLLPTTDSLHRFHLFYTLLPREFSLVALPSTIFGRTMGPDQDGSFDRLPSPPVCRRGSGIEITLAVARNNEMGGSLRRAATEICRQRGA
jgi:hypothetical protein